MELGQLRQFLRIAQTENFTRAAEQLGLSQPALSRSIARLEDELGRPLFDRQSRRIALTDAGRLLLDRARLIVTMVDDMKSEIRDDAQAGPVRVAAIPTIAPFLLPALLQSFRRAFPRSQVIVSEDTTSEVLKKIADGDVDLAIATQPIVAKYIDVESLFDEELYLVTSRNHPLARKRTVSATDVANQPFVLLGEAHCLSENVLAFCQQRSFHPVSIERTSQLAMVQELVSLGHGVSLVPAMARARDASRDRHYRSLAGPKPTRTIVLLTNPYRYHSQIVRSFREHVLATAAAKR